MEAGMQDEIDVKTLDECVELQQDELAALDAIYGDEWRCVGINKFEIDVRSDNTAAKSHEFVNLTVTFVGGYPLLEPPAFYFHAPWLHGTESDVLQDILIDAYLSSFQEPIIFRWVTDIKDFMESCLERRYCNEVGNAKLSDSAEVFIRHQYTVSTCLSPETVRRIEKNLVSSGLTVDRKSYFQGHCMRVKSKQDVDDVMLYLLSIPKVAKATHNIQAFRFTDEKGVMHADNNEDGEKQAGGRLSHLLELTKVDNVLVVVSRWFGGIHLGPDRFKHINQAARDVLVKAKFIK